MAAGVATQHVEGFVHGNAALGGQGPFGLLDDDAAVQCFFELLVDAPLPVQFGGVYDVAGGHVGQNAGSVQVIGRPVSRAGAVQI